MKIPSIKRVIFLFVLFAAGNSAWALEFVTEGLPLKLDNGASIHASILRPARASGEKLPALMVFGGFENAAEVLRLLDPKVPVVLASFDYPYQGPRKFEFPSGLQEAPKLKAASRKTLQGIGALTRSLKSRSDVDPQRIGIVGASFGSPFAIAAAAEDPSLSRLIIVHGFADIPGTIEHRLAQIWERKMGIFSSPAAWISARLITLYLDPPAPETQAVRLQASQKVLMIEATGDEFIPLASRKLLRESLEVSDAEIHHIRMPGGHLMPGSEKLIGEIMRISTDWMGLASKHARR